MASEFTIDIQLTELGFHQLPVFDEELPVKEAPQNSSSGSPVNPAPPKLSPAPVKSPPKSSSEPLATPSESLSAPPKLSPAPSNPPLQTPSKSSPVPTQVIPLSNKPPLAVNSPVDQHVLCVVQRNVHSLPKTMPMAIMVTNAPSSQSTSNVQPQHPQFLAVINNGTLLQKAAPAELNSTKKPEDILTDVVFTGEKLTLGGKDDGDGKKVSNEKKAIVVRYTGKQNSAEKKATAAEEVVGKEGTKSQSNGQGSQSQENNSEDDSDDSEVSEEDEEEEEEETDEEDDSLFFAPDAAREHRCNVCDQTFTNGFLLREHMHQHTGVRPYRCAECGKQFCQLANYRAHLRTHAQAVPIRCQVCQASFETEERLQLHLQTTHFEDEFYQCDYCKRIFTCMNECMAHVHKHKTEARQPRCEKCGRRFLRLKSLRRHMAKHSCLRSFLCSDCGQSFRKKNVLLRHSFSHLGLLPYTCTHCKIHFRLAGQYRKHKCKPESIQCVACLTTFTSHKDFEDHKRATGCWGYQGAQGNTLQKQKDEIRCMECGQTFGTAEELKKHAGSHQRVLKCAECGMGFRSSLMLMSHMGGHVGQKPCLCQKCGLGFPHQQGYDLHLKDCGVPAPPKVKKPKPASSKTAKKLPSIASKNTASSSHQSNSNEINSATGAQTRPPESAGWKLTLDKTPPLNTPLVVLLPVSAPIPPSLSVTAAAAEPQTVVLSTPQNGSLNAALVQPRQTQGSGANNTVPNPPALQSTVLNETNEAPLALVCEKRAPQTPPQPQPLPQPCLNTTVVKTEPESPGYSAACMPSDCVSLFDVTSGLQVKEEAKDMKPDKFKFCEEKVVTTPEAEIKLKDELKSSDSKTEMQVEDFKMPPVLNGPDSSENLEQSGLLISDVRSESLEFSPNLLITDVRSESSVVAPFKDTGEQTEHVATETSSQVPGLLDTPLDLRLNLNHSDARAETLSQGNTVSGVTESHSEDVLEANPKVTEDFGFTTMEVDLRDEHKDGLGEEGEEEEGEPHECVNCGAIILDGDLIEHYMQHAVEGHKELTKTPPRPQSPTGSLSSSSSYCPSASGYSSPNISPPASPPSKRLRSRAK